MLELAAAGAVIPKVAIMMQQRQMDDRNTRARDERHAASHRRSAQYLMRLPGAYRCLLLGLLSTGGSWPALADQTARPVAGYWARHDEIERLEDLPKRYSCNDLYYKYRDVLALLGAPAGASILSFGCSGTSGTSLKDPTRVELRYQIATPFPASAQPQASLKIAQRTITLQPGSPRSLQADDCALVQKMAGLLIPASGAHVESSVTHCSPAEHAGGDYHVVIRTWASLDGPQVSAP